MDKGKLLLLLVIVCVYREVVGNGYMVDPPARASMWRLGYDTPINYNDMNINCGGIYKHLVTNNGVCGVCGDPADGVRHHEGGGYYATGVITRTYKQGGIIPIRVNLTSAHGGWFEFRLCPNNDVTKAAQPECFEMHLLRLADDPEQTRFTGVPSGGPAASRSILMEYQLPADLTCSHCVLQWLYHTGKDWGCDEANFCALGLGNQEEFIGCSDIAITVTGDPDGTGGTGPTSKPSERASSETITTTTTTTRPPSTVTTQSTASTRSLTPEKTSRTATTTATTATTTTTTTSATTTTLGPLIPIEDCQALGVLVGLYDQFCRDRCVTVDNCMVAFCNEKCHERARQLERCNKIGACPISG